MKSGWENTVKAASERNIVMIQFYKPRVESTGKLTWDLIIEPSQKMTLDLRYSVKYPTSRSVIVE